MYYSAPTASGCQLLKTTCQGMKAILCHDFQFPTVYHRIYCNQCLTLSNQTLHFIHKGIRHSWPIIIWRSLRILTSLCCGVSSIQRMLKSLNTVTSFRQTKYDVHEMRFPTMWYMRPAKPQTSLHIRTGWSEPLLVAWVFYECKATDRASLGVS